MTKEVLISGTGSRIGSRRRKEADSPPETIRSEAMDVVSTVAGYDRWSEIYDAEENPLILLEEKHMPALVGEVAGLDVVDVGCGTGRHALRLAAARAHVTAIDFSQEMLNRARAKPGSDSVRFIQHDIAGDLPLKSGSFDRVFCCLVLDHIAALKKFFAELARVRRSNGLIIISVMHPAMMLRGVQARFTDPASRRKISPQSYPNQISDYVMAAKHAGLNLDHLSEHAIDANLAAVSERAARYLDWPMLLLMRLTGA